MATNKKDETMKLEQLGTAAATYTMQGAADYLAKNDIEVTDYKAASDILREACKAALDGALADAKQAIEANMGDVAVTTFRATFRMAGINAAKNFDHTITRTA